MLENFDRKARALNLVLFILKIPEINDKYKQILLKFKNLGNLHRQEKKLYYCIQYLKKKTKRNHKSYYVRITQFRTGIKVLPQIKAGKVIYFQHTF